MCLSKSLNFIIAAACAVALSACGNSQHSDSSSATPAATGNQAPQQVLNGFRIQANAVARAATAAANNTSSVPSLADLTAQLDQQFADMIKAIQDFDPNISDPDLKKQFDDAKAEMIKLLQDQLAQIKDLFAQHQKEIEDLLNMIQSGQLPSGVQLPPLPQAPQIPQLPQIPGLPSV
jgi:hypothetical protein